MGARADADRGVATGTPEEVRRYIDQKVVPGKFDWIPKTYPILNATGTATPTGTTYVDVPGVTTTIIPKTRVACIVSSKFVVKTTVVAAGVSVEIDCDCQPAPISRTDLGPQHYLTTLDEYRDTSGYSRLVLDAGVTYTIKMKARLDSASAGRGVIQSGSRSGMFLLTTSELA